VPDVKDWVFVRRAVPWLATPLSTSPGWDRWRWWACCSCPGASRAPPTAAAARCASHLIVVRACGLAVIAASLALFYVMGRYRLPASPCLWILAAGLLVSLADARRRVTTLAACAVAVGLGQLPLRAGAGGLQDGWAAASEVERSLARAADSPAPAVRHRDAAADDARQALALRPDFPEARLALVYALDLRTPFVESQPVEANEAAWRLLLVMEGARTGLDVSAALAGPLPAAQQAAVELRAQPTAPGRELYVSTALAIACRRVAQDLKQPAQLPLALDLMDEALRLRPDDDDGIVQRGLVLQRLHRDTEAEQAYRDALARGVDTLGLHANFGLLLLDSGRAAEAVSQLQRAAQLDPDNDVVRRALDRARAGG
jgi:tetratricopeptide (TPR) repeat protein